MFTSCFRKASLFKLGSTPTFELKLLLISCWSEYNLGICSWFSTWCKHILRWIQDFKYIWELTVIGASVTPVLNQHRLTHQLFAHSQSYQLLQSLLSSEENTGVCRNKSLWGGGCGSCCFPVVLGKGHFSSHLFFLFLGFAWLPK